MKWKGIHPDDVKLLPEGRGWLMVEFGGETREEADAKARKLMDRLRGGPSMKLFDTKSEEKHLWRVREAGLGATARKENGKENWEDGRIHRSRRHVWGSTCADCASC